MFFYIVRRKDARTVAILSCLPSPATVGILAAGEVIDQFPVPAEDMKAIALVAQIAEVQTVLERQALAAWQAGVRHQVTLDYAAML